MRSTLIVLALIFSQKIYCQNFISEFGKISSKEIEMSTYEEDQEAGAVILFDVGKSEFFDTNEGYDIRFTRHKRIKIFDKSALEFAEISIPFYINSKGKAEKIKSIKAVTYNYEDGYLNKQTLDPTTIYEEVVNSRWHIKKFAFPNVKKGSIVEFKYVLETPFHFNLPDWRFQDKIPTIYSQYEVRMIPFYEYVFLVQGVSHFDYQNSAVSKQTRTWGSVAKAYGQNIGSGIEFQDYVQTYALKNVPAFKDESYISSVDDYIIKMDMQLAKFHSPRGGSRDIITTWPELNKALLKSDEFGKYIKQCKRYSKKIIDEEIQVNHLNSANKAKTIINYVKNSFNWNGNYSKYASQTAKDFFTSKAGNSADINLFLVSLLNSADIKATPVILSTRGHGKINSNYPFDHFLNYIIVFVDDENKFLADATEFLLPFNRIPTRCFNDGGLLVQNDSEKWLNLSNNIRSVENNVISISIDPGSVEASYKLSIQTSEYEAFYYRKKFKDEKSKISNYFSDRIGNIEDLKTFNYKNTSLPYSISIKGQPNLEKIGDHLVISPFLNLALTENKLNQKERSYPVDFIHPTAKKFDITVNIPEGYTIKNLPPKLTLNDSLVEISIQHAVTEGFLRIKGIYSFKKPVYQPSEYNLIKSHLDEIVKNFNSEIIFTKK